MSEILNKEITEEIGINNEKTLLDPSTSQTLELDNANINENKNKHLDSMEDLAEKDSLSNVTNNNKNSKQNPECQSLKNSPTRDIYPSLLVPKDNLDNLLSKLESAGNFKTSNIDNLGLTEDQEELKVISNNNKMSEDNKNFDGNSKHVNNIDNSSNINAHNTLKNTKNLIFSNIKSINIKAPRETTILDEKFNVLEVLNEKNNLLITESNENYSDSSREENNQNFANKNFSHRKVESMNINMTEYHLKPFEEATCLNQLDNFATYDNFILPNKKDSGSLQNDKFININDLSKKVSILWKSQIKNLPINSQNFNNNNKKNQINNKSRNSKMTKSTDMSTTKGGKYSDSMITSNTSTKFTQKQKTKLGSSNPPNKSSLVKSIDKKLPNCNINKNLNTSIKTIKSTSKTPPKTKNNIPMISNRTSKVMHKDSLNKNLIMSNKKAQIAGNGVNKNSLANSHNDSNSKMSISNKKNDTHKVTRDTPFSIISEECDYSKILLELKCIFGENLENFDEQCMTNYKIKYF